MSSKLPLKTFKTVVSAAPLVSIDLLVRNSAGEVLLGKRLNRPAQGYWFVPGGRILKDESLAHAFLRLTQEELGVAVPMDQAEFLGPFEHFYSDNFSGEEFSTHYVALGYQLELDASLEELPYLQHREYRWWPVKELLSHSEVHKHTKWYVRFMFKN